MRLTIIGCGGFIGSHLLDRLLSTGSVEIIGWDPDVKKIQQHLADPKLFVHQEPIGTAESYDALRESIRWAEIVVNLAGICNPGAYNTRPLDVIRANFTDACAAVELCAMERKWLITFSTSEVYGRTISSYLRHDRYERDELFELSEDQTPLVMGPVSNQRWSYATAKQLMERFVYANHYTHDLPFTIIRPFNFFGPRMDFIPGQDGEGVPRVLACFMRALMTGSPLQLVDGGKQRRTILSIHDAISALTLVLSKPEKAQNQIFNVGSPQNEVTIAELAVMMRSCYADITGLPSYREHPIERVEAEEFYGPGYEDCDRRMPTIAKAKELLGWTPRIGLPELLHETMTYYHNSYAGRM